VLVDTSVWSLALRRKQPSTHRCVDRLKDLLTAGESVIYLGIILTEILQGVSSDPLFRQIEKQFDGLDFIEATKSDYVSAAKLATACRRKGIQASTIDFLIAAIAIQHNLWLLTTDDDFTRIASVSSLKLLT
jgi:hypothetical protein